MRTQILAGAAVITAGLSLSACATDSDVLRGAGIGAAGGALVGAVVPGVSTTEGAIAGAATGAVVGAVKDPKD